MKINYLSESTSDGTLIVGIIDINGEEWGVQYLCTDMHSPEKCHEARQQIKKRIIMAIERNLK